MAAVYEVEVLWTDRTRNDDGGYVSYTARIEVLADTDTEATLVASQMAHAIRADLDPMILSAEIISIVL
jgi:hypothetical protein